MNDTARNDAPKKALLGTRSHVINALYEAAELEHNLMCTYLYAAFSLKSGEEEGLTAEQASAVRRWRRVLLDVAIEEMGHLTAVWNITSALGSNPRVGRTNFPLDPGYLPAGIVVKLAPFNAETLQHFIFLERPHGSTEPEGEGFVAETRYIRGTEQIRLIPQGINYDTVGEFYVTLGEALRGLAAKYGEDLTFGGDPALQLSPNEVTIPGAKPVRCLKTALAAFDAIVLQGEGAPRDSADSHYQKFIGIRSELRALQEKNPDFAPAYPAATNPVLRRPPRPEGRVWLEDSQAIAVVDLANASYQLMLRLLAYAYTIPGPDAEKSLVIDLAIGLMGAMSQLAERAARLPAGPSNPACHAGVSFTALRDSGAFPRGRAARRAVVERLGELTEAGEALRSTGDARLVGAATQLAALLAQAKRGFDLAAPGAARAGAGVTSAPVASASAARAPTTSAPVSASAPTSAAATAPASAVPRGEPRQDSKSDMPSGATTMASEVEKATGEKVDILFEAKRCIHARFCVTGAPKVFLANVQGPWIHPDAMEVESVVEIAHACPSGAIQYKRHDGVHDEQPPPVNLAAIREGGPYAIRAQLTIDGQAHGYRVTLCRCGASKNKPFCDGTHHAIGFSATGEPPSGKTDMLPVRDGPLTIDCQLNGPLKVRGNLEITSGTGRVVSRGVTAFLCRCGGSANKPFCDGTHSKIGFKSTE
jgi:CDGSH-type Zn-finger protein/uncharacterized Fe-S cluster protein YjdI